MLRTTSLILTFALSALGCNKSEPSPESKTKADAEPAAKQPALDPDLAEAVAQASAAPAASGAPVGAEGGPPPDGVFAPGAADKELLRGALPKITLGSEGSEPRVLLGPKSPQKLSGTIQIATQSDPRMGAIPILLSLQFDPKKPDAAAADTAPVSLPVTVRITGAKIDAPSVPKEIDVAVGKLKGSKVEYSVLPSGAGAGFRFDVPKDASEEVIDVARSLSDALSLLTLPYPDKPLGAGGFFMVTSREDFLGNDLVSYRLVKVKQLEGNVATLEVNTKRYAASRTFSFPGLPAEIPKNLAEFQANSEGTVELPIGALLPTQGQVTSLLAAALGEEDVRQRAMLQFQTRALLDLKAPAAAGE
jgi:hypothetical protein